MGGSSVARVLESEAMMVPCARSRSFAGGSQRSCIYSRGQTVRPEVYEYQLDAMFASAFRRTGGDGPAFASIVGSGELIATTTTAP